MSDKESRSDPESCATDAHLYNSTIEHLTWRGVTVTVKDRETKQPRNIVDDAFGIVRAGASIPPQSADLASIILVDIALLGEMCALMGPSGCGKTTLLNVLAGRPTNASKVESDILVNGKHVSKSDFRQISCFVEQEDALIGSLTVRETLDFSSRKQPRPQTAHPPHRRPPPLFWPHRAGRHPHRHTHPQGHLGWAEAPRRRREPAAHEPEAALPRRADQRTGLGRQLGGGQLPARRRPPQQSHRRLLHPPTQYFGSVETVVPHFEQIGVQVPNQVNPAEFLLELVNIDFARDKEAAAIRLGELQEAWETSPTCKSGRDEVEVAARSSSGLTLDSVEKRPGSPSLVLTLLHRSFIKSYRDVVAYGIRIAMYLGLAIMVGTVWVRLSATQTSIQPLINALFFGSAFMSFMAVAYVPAFLEDRFQYVKEHQNGLYGAAEFIVSNFIIGVPYLFLISVLFSIISYWLVNFQPTAVAFFTWVMWLFLDLLAAESLVIFISSLVPSFVISLALVAFANGLWMAVGGFMVPPTILNVFYKYVFHYWDYQKYVFQGMMVNEFADRVYSCGSGCRCMYDSPLADQCEIAGQAVLDQYGYATDELGQNVGIMVAIIFGYRLAAWIVLKLRR
ncbi:ABC transporter [Purpureocillium lilacinum]|uniref:ABC transporter n=1 Tax=Purpureocillium lilacinum TaxID=33203 RepID=A0A179HXI3_PURLI|nr:ABC transporter [Purpureocillium lilacinum]OAQ95235.1 ABC transporter [Purpureocillium lilacinum]